MVSKKSKKNQDNISTKLGLVTKSGKYSLGYKSTLKLMRSGNAKLVLYANNTPPLRRSELQYYSHLSKVPVYAFPGNNNDLGTACGKYFRVGSMTIVDTGDSDIMTMIE